MFDLLPDRVPWYIVGPGLGLLIVGLFVVPAEGGEPRRLTFHPEGDTVRGWTPDGSRVVSMAKLPSGNSFDERPEKLYVPSPLVSRPTPPRMRPRSVKAASA